MKPYKSKVGGIVFLQTCSQSRLCTDVKLGLESDNLGYNNDSCQSYRFLIVFLSLFDKYYGRSVCREQCYNHHIPSLSPFSFAFKLSLNVVSSSFNTLVTN